MYTKKIIKNTVAYWVGQVANKLLIFFLTIAIARLLGPGEFGKYSLVVTIVGFCWLLSDAGLGLLTFREVAKDRDLTKEYFSHSIFLKSSFSAVCVVLLILLTSVLQYDRSVKILLLVYSVTIFTKALSSSCVSLYNAYEEMSFTAVFSVVANLIPLLVCYLILNLGHGLKEVFFIISGSYLIVSTVNLLFASRRYHSFKFEFNLSFSLNSLKQSIPLMLAGFLGYVAFGLSILMLSKMKGNTALGFFSAPFRLIEGLILFPTGFMTAIFPVLSRYSENSLEKLKSMCRLSLKTLLVIGLALAVGTTLLADKIIYFFYGQDYSCSVIPLIILIWALLMIYLTSVFYNILLVSGKQNIVVVLQIICIIICFLLNVLLIPSYSFIGAAFSVLGTQIFSLILFATVANKLILRRIY